MALTGVIAAVVVDWFVDAADESFADSVAELALWSPSAAVTLLASIGRGMVTSTGFVFSVVLLIIQFGSASYSPRTVSYFLRSRVTQSILAVFVGTTSYAFLALISIGSAGRDTYVPFLGAGVPALPAGQPRGLACADPERGGPDQGRCLTYGPRPGRTPCVVAALAGG